MHPGFLFGVFQYRSEKGGCLIFWSISCLLFMSHIWFLSHVWMFYVTHILFLSHVAHMTESCRTCECVKSHMRMSHVAHMNESRSFQDLVLQMRCSMLCRGVLRCSALQCVAVSCSVLQCGAVSCSVFFSVQRFKISSCKDGHPPSRHKCDWVMSHTRLCHNATYGWVMSHIWTSCVSHMMESCLVYEWVISLTRLSHNATKKERKKATRARLTLHSSFFTRG